MNAFFSDKILWVYVAPLKSSNKKRNKKVIGFLWIYGFVLFKEVIDVIQVLEMRPKPVPVGVIGIVPLYAWVENKVVIDKNFHWFLALNICSPSM